jgi:hypothetical protein
VSALANAAGAPALCRACGHRLALHGFSLRETWCIAWDGAHFCGCQAKSNVEVVQ